MATPPSVGSMNPEPAIPLPSQKMDIGVWMAVLSASAFAAKAVLVKLIYHYGVDPLSLLCLRMLLSLPIFLVLALRGGAIPRREWPALLGLGALGYYLSALLDFTGLSHITAGLERLVLFTHPTLVVLMGAVWMKRKVPPGFAWALLLSWGGIALAMGPELRLGDPHQVAMGVGLVFCSAISYAIYLLKGGELMVRLGGQRVSAISTSIGTGLLLGNLGLTHGFSSLWNQPKEVYALSLLLALGSTVLPVLLLGEAISRIGPARTSAIGTVGPVVTLGLGWLFLGESLTWIQFAGAILVFAGVWNVAKTR